MVLARKGPRRAVAVLAALAMFMVGPLPSPASAAPPPPSSPAPYTCPPDPDLAAALGTGSVAEFLALWTPRLTRDVPVLSGLGGPLPGIPDLDGVPEEVDLDEFVNREELPTAIADEGYHALDAAIQGCLIAHLYDELDTTLADFPDPSISRDAALAVLYGLVFDNQWVEDFKEGDNPTAGGTPTDTPIPVDAVDGILEALREVPLPGVPPVVVPPELSPVPLVVKTTEDLLGGITNPVSNLFTDVGNVVEHIGLPTTLPTMDVPTAGIEQVINTLRRVVDSTMYRVCWLSEKLPTHQCVLTDVPLGTPVSIDVAGDSRPDVVAQLTPETAGVDPDESVRMRWTVTRLPDLVTGHRGPIRAQVYSFFTIPTGDLMFSVGSDGFPSTLAQRSDYMFTLTDIEKAIAGETVVDIRLLHEAPGARSAVTYGVIPLSRDADNLGQSSVEHYDVGALRFSPVPAAPAAIEVRLTVKSADLDEDGAADQRVGVNLTMPQPGVTLRAVLRSKLPPAEPPPGEERDCCPYREIVGVVTTLPTQAGVVIDSFPALRTTDVRYDADAVIDRLDVTSKLFADTDGDFPTGADRDNFTRMVSRVDQVPKDVHVRMTTSDPEVAAKDLKVHYDASAPVPHVEFTTEEYAHDPATNAAALQRRLFASADTIPTVIDLETTTTEISDRHSTGTLDYSANGRITNVHAEVLDVVNTSELVAEAASLPPTIHTDYDIEGAADLDSEPGCEAPGHTIVRADARSSAAAAPGSDVFGQLTAKFRSGVDAFLTPDPSIAELDHAILNIDTRSPATCLDDTTQADLRYGGLRAVEANILESGEISATVRNDVEKPFVFQVAKPDQRLTTKITNLPKKVRFSKSPVGGSDEHMKIEYDGCTPGASMLGTGWLTPLTTTCAPKSVDSVAVRLDGLGTTGKFKEGEFVDVTASGVPGSIEVDLNLPEAEKSQKVVQYDASDKTSKVTAAVNKTVEDLGNLSIAAEVSGIPKRFETRFGEEQPIVFKAGDGESIDQVKAAITNTGTALAPAAFAPHAAVKYLESPTSAELEASLGMANLSSFSMAPGDAGNFTGSMRTNPPASGPNPNATFTVMADVLTLEKNGTTRNPDLKKATVIRTGGGGAVIDPLPAAITVSKQGGEQADGTDTSQLTIDATGSTGDFTVDADIALGGPGSVADAMSETLDRVQGVAVGDGATLKESDAIRLRLYLPATPQKSVVRYGQITEKGPNRPSVPADGPSSDPAAQPSFDISGFGSLPGGKLDIVLRMDDKPHADRLAGDISLGSGVGPGLGFVRFFPIRLGNDPGLDLNATYAAGATAGPLRLDLRMGESTTAPGRADKRVLVETGAVPPQVTFDALAIEEAEAHQDPVTFKAEFRDAAGNLTASPGTARVRYQMPTKDGADNPTPKVTLDLADVPSRVNFVVGHPADVKSGNPTNQCGLRTSTTVLPTLRYSSAGVNADQLDVNGEIDIAAFVDEVPSDSALDGGPPPKVIFELTDLADGFRMDNNAGGDVFELGTGAAKTERVLVKVVPLDLTLLHIYWKGCANPHTIVGWRSNGEARFEVNTQLRLEIVKQGNMKLHPGFATGIEGDFANFSMALPDPMLKFSWDNLSSGVQIRLSSDIHFLIPALWIPGTGSTTGPLPIVFHVAKNEPGKWFGWRSPIPCVVPGVQLSVEANIQPHRKALALNHFAVDGSSSWVATADPFGISASLNALIPIDIIDTITGLFASPLPDKGLKAPSVTCSAGAPGFY
jgi:hypothetical protein